LAAALSVLPILALAACGDDSGGDATDKEHTIGLIVPTQGAQTELGSEVRAGFEIALKDASTDGWTFTPKVVDEGTTPDKSVEAARSLVGSGVKNVAGLVSSADCAAVAPVVEQLGGTLVSTTCSSDALTTPKLVSESFFDVAAGDFRYNEALAAVIAEKFPELSKLGIFAWDYPVGKESPIKFRDALGQKGVDVDLDPEFYVPIQAASYRAQISKMAGDLSAGDPATKGVLLIVGGGATTSFLQQASAFDLLDSVSFVGGPSEPYVGLRTLKGAFPNYWAAYDYFHSAVDTPENAAFVKAFTEERGVAPSGFAWQGYAAGSSLAAAIKAAGGADPDAVQKALLEIEVPTPTGAIKFDAKTHRTNSPSVIVNVVGDPSEADGVKLLDAFRVDANGNRVE